MPLNLVNFKSPKKEIYESLWKDHNFDFDVVEIGKKDPSYEFGFSGRNLIDYAGKSIASSFDINNTDNYFVEKFRMACSGTGDEIKKITTLHSSSLCALLFFFNVDKKKLEIPELEGYEFTESYFEFQNKVIGYPSNIDVVLLGININTNQKVILFLESKFSEYITGIGKEKVGTSYFKPKCYSAPIYKYLEDKNCFDFSEKNGFANSKKYNEGLKQLISHYYGIRRFMEKEFVNKDNETYKNVREYDAKEILLGEILFDSFAKTETLKSYLDNYETDYSSLADIINKQYENDSNKPKEVSFRVLTSALHYSCLNDYISEFPKIKNFYFWNNNTTQE